MTISINEEISETRVILDSAWSKLPDALKGPTQFLGKQYTGCGATIGVMPQCDLSCAACYLGEGVNHAKPLSIDEIKLQIKTLRRWLGPGGNLQLTDGEVTLRDESEIIELISYAREVGLVPMVMTNGEQIRKRPGFLERMMKEGGLTEISFHVDTSMRGRKGKYAEAVSEEELNGLRAEFAEIIRSARSNTGLKLEAASTVTVMHENIESVPMLVRWFLANADAFKMVAFLPVASVGRTGSQFEGITSELLWARIADGAGDPQLLRGEGGMGHPSCGRFVQGVAIRRKKGPVLVPLYQRDNKHDMQFLSKLLGKFGGTTFRLDSRSKAIGRVIHLAKGNLYYLLRHGLPYSWRLLKRTRTLNAHYFCIVSHHFMNASELKSPLGVERSSVCAFRVPINGELVSMCKCNVSGMRDQVCRSTHGATMPDKKRHE